MLEVKLKLLLSGMESLGYVRDSIGRWTSNPSGLVGDEKYKPHLLQQIQTIRSELDNLQIGGVGVFLALDRLEGSVKNEHAQLVEMYINEFKKVLHDELSGTFVLSLSNLETRLYHQAVPLLEEKVAKQFESLTYEIDEIGKCLAFSRSTAAAFHSIRCLEGGIRALSRCLSIPDPTKGAERSWANMLREIDKQIKKKWPTAADRMGGDGHFFEEAYGALAGMQNPYRNATMHLDQKYTLDEARHILEMVKGFMIKIASRMDENGQPLA